MNKTQGRFKTWSAALCLLLALGVATSLAMPQSESPDDPTNSTGKKKVKVTKSSAPKGGQPAASTNPGSGSGVTAAALVSDAPKLSAKGASSASDISTAKATGKVWVNLDSGVYHKRGRWYGKTKNGKFMSPEEAKKAGYRPAKRE